MNNMAVYRFMFPVYGRLVMAGKYTVAPNDSTKKQVPEEYVQHVIEWLAAYEETSSVTHNG